jgi:polyhydroxyalkanoate synthesis regulator phasin
MPDSENILQKAFYLGVGIASYAAEKASETIQELKQKAEHFKLDQDFPVKIQKLADEMVDKGKLTAEEAKNFVDEMMKQAQANISETPKQENREPRTIEIIGDDEE